jgi:hypothetical protein
MSLQQNPPFQPVSFPPGPPTAVKWEDAKKVYPPYNGQSQTSRINTAAPMPPWELGPGPADPQLSSAKADYAGSGYGTVGKGTLGAGNLTTVAPQGVPAQARMFLQGNNLVILDNNGTAYVVPATATIPQPAVYSPTK